MRSKIATELATQYPFTINGVSSYAGRSNDLYRLDTTDGEYVCKLFSEDVELDRTLPLLEELSEAGLPVAAPVHTVEGDRLVDIDDQPAILMRFVEGADFDGSIPQVSAAGRTLGNVHTISSEFTTPTVDIDLVTELEEYLEVFETYRSEAITETELTEEDLTQLASVTETCKENLSGYEPPESARMFIHGDYNDQNVLFDDEDDVALVTDWEDARTGLAYTDLVKGANKFAIKDLEYDSAEIDREKVATFVNAYRDQTDIPVPENLFVNLLRRNAISSTAWGIESYAEHGDELFREVLEWYAANLHSVESVADEIEQRLA